MATAPATHHHAPPQHAATEALGSIGPIRGRWGRGGGTPSRLGQDTDPVYANPPPSCPNNRPHLEGGGGQSFPEGGGAVGGDPPPQETLSC